MGYYLSPALNTLRTEVNTIWPHRDKTSDGWIGDTSHAARPSDHNPDWEKGGIVRAIDIDEDLVIGLDFIGEAMPLVNAIIQDKRVAYVIYEGRIWQNPAVYRNGGWYTYTGVNAHRHHVHISVRNGLQWDSDSSSWHLLSRMGIVPTPLPDLPQPTPMEDYDMDTIFRATDAYDIINAGWSYLQGSDGILRALSTKEFESRTYAYKSATGRDYPIVGWAGKDLAALATSCGLYEYTGSTETGPLGLTGRILGRNAPFTPGSTYGNNDRSYPVTILPKSVLSALIGAAPTS